MFITACKPDSVCERDYVNAREIFEEKRAGLMRGAEQSTTGTSDQFGHHLCDPVGAFLRHLQSVCHEQLLSES